ncbi:MAG: hypothetical protein LQ347_002680 [Umbilicaria vellea]|nr:MAG: hypothetical protein LQ347_002680 [Umbilicaria vellea]
MATKWTDAEKNALLVSIIATNGPVKWDQITIPPGRTKKACIHIYDQAKKQAADHNLNDAGSSSAPATPKTPKTPKKAKATTNGTATADTTPKAKATPKRKRSTKAKGNDVSGPGKDEKADDSVVKKQKMEDEAETIAKEDDVKGDGEQVAVKDEDLKGENGESGEEG